MALVNYGNWEDLEKLLVGKRIVSATKDRLTLEDGTIVEVKESEYACCASADGEWSNVTLDAVITAVKIEDERTVEYQNCFEADKYATVVVYHNQNVIAQANCEANNGNGGYYYSVCSLVVKDVHYKVVECDEV